MYVQVETLPFFFMRHSFFTHPNPLSNAGMYAYTNRNGGFKSPIATTEGFLTSSQFQAYFLSEKVSNERRK